MIDSTEYYKPVVGTLFFCQESNNRMWSGHWSSQPYSSQAQHIAVLPFFTFLPSHSLNYPYWLLKKITKKLTIYQNRYTGKNSAYRILVLVTGASQIPHVVNPDLLIVPNIE